MMLEMRAELEVLQSATKSHEVLGTSRVDAYRRRSRPNGRARYVGSQRAAFLDD